jgi:hypothetical protein
MGTRSSRGQRDEGSKENPCPNGGGGEGPEKDSCLSVGRGGPFWAHLWGRRVLKRTSSALWMGQEGRRGKGRGGVGGGLRGGLGGRKKIEETRSEKIFFFIRL